MMEKSYPIRYNREYIGRYRDLISRKLKVESVSIERRMEPRRAELLLVEDASLFPRGLVNEPPISVGLRADVIYIDEALGRVRFSGPIGGGYQDQPPREPDLPLPLPALLWRERVEAGVWILLSGEGMPRLLRVTEELVEHGRTLFRELNLGSTEEAIGVGDL